MENESENKIPARNASHSDAGGKNKSVRTYVEDMSSVIKENKEGVIKKIIHEQEDHEREKVNLSPESGRNKTFLLVGFLLILLAICTLFFLAFFREQIFTVPLDQKYVPIIFTDQNKFLEIGELPKDKITQSFLNELNSTKLKVSGVESVYFTENQKVVGFDRFLSLIKSDAPLEIKNLVNNNFLLGIFSNKDTKNLFILLKVKSFPDIFPLFRSWEGKMFSDFASFFNVNINSDTKYLLTKDFEDGIINNKNARILHDKDGNIVLAYIFVDDTSVIFTNGIESANEITIRLESSKVKK